MPGPVIVERADATVTITLHRPTVLNALNRETKEALLAALTAIPRDPSIRSVILTGAGRAFCAGQDLREAKDMSGAEAEEWVRGFEHLYAAIRALDVPVIAAVHGWAVGAGCQLALLADIRIATPTARFAMPEVRDGIPAILGLALLFPHLGLSRSLHLVLTGEALTARQALAAGLIARTVAQRSLLREAGTLAARLAAFAPVAVARNKQFARRLTDEQFRTAVEFATAAHRDAFASGEARRGMEAFLAGKRGASGR